MHTFSAYREDDLLRLPFFSVLDLYNRALEIVTGDVIEPKSSIHTTDLADELVYNIHTGQYE
jgi:hypothetical protein